MNDETKAFLVDLFDVKLAQNKKEIKEELTELFDVKLEQNKNEIKEELTGLFDQKFAEQDAKIDQKFAEQDAKIDQKFAEQNALFDAKFDELRFDVTQTVQDILKVVGNKFKRERKKTDEKLKNKIAIL